MQLGKLDFNTEEERALVQEVFENAMESLSVEDRSLPQVEHCLPLLKRGIGVHHSGLLPIIKVSAHLHLKHCLCLYWCYSNLAGNCGASFPRVLAQDLVCNRDLFNWR